MIRAYLGGSQLDIEFGTFAGGERNVRIKGFQWPSPFNADLKEKMPEGKDLVVYAHVDSSDAIMDLLLFTDAFNRMGRGSTGVACKELNREFIGMETDPGFFNAAIERLR